MVELPAVKSKAKNDPKIVSYIELRKEYRNAG